jgi:hypothetical protein
MASITFYDTTVYSQDVVGFAKERGAKITFEEDYEEETLTLTAPTRQELFDFVVAWEVEIGGGPSIDEEEIMELIED